jgi:hypothetical protein
LKGAVIGIDASHYINQHLVNQSTREALLGALGGFPFALRANIEKELQTFKNLGVACIFVFNGLTFGKREQRAQPAASRSFEQAWDLYDQQQADQVVDAFSSAGMITYPIFHVTPMTDSSGCTYYYWTQQDDPIADTAVLSGTPPPETLFRFLQRILHQNGVEFIVAPYSAVAEVSGSCMATQMSANQFLREALLPCPW